MKAIRIYEHGDPSVLKLEDLPTPKPGPDEALVQIKSIGLNFIDIYMRTGRYRTPLPFTPGYEGAGIVQAVGENVSVVKVGDRVAYTTTLGSYAEYNLVKANDLIPLSESISFEEGAAFLLQGITAQYLLHEYYPIQPGTKVLVHAAAGGVGLLLVQWLKHLGAMIIGTVSSQAKADIVKAAGANHVILYTKEDFVPATLAITDGVGVDYIIDGVGKTTFTKDLEAVRKRGHICIYGSASGPADPLQPNSLQAKSLTISGATIFNYLNTRQELLQRANAVLQGIQQGWLKLKIDYVLPLAEAAKAQSLLENRQTQGKVILQT